MIEISAPSYYQNAARRSLKAFGILCIFMASSHTHAELNLDTIEKLSQDPKCDTRVADGSLANTVKTLLLTDVIIGAVDRNMLTPEIIGSTSVYGLKPYANRELISFYDYAERDDIAKAIRKDVAALNSQAEKLKKEFTSDPRAALFSICELSKFLTGKESLIDDAFESYSNELTKRSLRNNLNNLNAALKNLTEPSPPIHSLTLSQARDKAREYCAKYMEGFTLQQACIKTEMKAFEEMRRE